MPSADELLGITLTQVAPAKGAPPPPPEAAPAPAAPTADELLAQASPETGLGPTIQHIIEQFARPTGAIVGGTAGTLLGGAGGGVGALPGGVAGAALGGMAGERLPEITRPFLTSQPAKPVTGADVANTVNAGLVEGTMQAAGGVVARGVNALAAPFKDKVIPFARDVVAPAMRRVGQRLSPGMMTDSRVLDTLENITESSLLGGGRLQALKRGVTEQGVQALTDDVLKHAGTTLSKEEVVGLLTDSRGAAQAMTRSIKGALYRNVDDLAKGVTVDMKPVLDELRGAIGGARNVYVEKALSAAGLSGMHSGPEDFLTVAIAGSDARAPETTFRIAQSARSRLLALARKPAVGADDQGIRNTAGYLASLIDKQMVKAARRLSPEALTAWREANKFTANAAEALDHQLVRRLAKTLVNEPTRVDRLLAAPNKADILKRVQASVDRSSFEQLQRKLAQYVIERSVDPATNVLQGQMLLERLKNMGPETAAMIFGPHRARVEQFARIVEFVQRHESEGTGRVMIQLAQGPAVFQIAKQPVSALARGAYTVLAGPTALARLLTNERSVRWLTEGVRHPEQFERNAKLIASMLAPLAAEPAAKAAQSGKRQ